jgi:hypothetical protein
MWYKYYVNQIITEKILTSVQISTALRHLSSCIIKSRLTTTALRFSRR